MTSFKKALAPAAVMLGMNVAGWMHGNHGLALLGMATMGLFLLTAAHYAKHPS